MLPLLSAGNRAYLYSHRSLSSLIPEHSEPGDKKIGDKRSLSMLGSGPFCPVTGTEKAGSLLEKFIGWDCFADKASLQFTF